MKLWESMVDHAKSFRFQKWVPIYSAVLLHVFLVIIAINGIGMTYILFSLHMNLESKDLGSALPWLLNHLMFFYSPPAQPNYVLLIITVILAPAAWLFGTRMKTLNKTLTRRKLSFFICAGALSIILCYYGSLYVKPIGFDKIVHIHDSFQSTYKDQFHRAPLVLIGYFILMLPQMIMFLIATNTWGKFKEDPVLQEWFAHYLYENRWLGRIGDETANEYPDITLAKKVLTDTIAVLTGVSRQLGTMLIGPPGSGKTSLKIVKAFRQDLGHMQKMINDFPRIVKKYGYHTPGFLKALGRHLIGSIIIEPSKDLCDKAVGLAKEHGLPEEFLTYLDPSNPETPGFNCMVGPTAQVAETITAVLDGMSEVSNEFFRQSCRTVLKMYIYLIKINRGDDCTLLDLDRMYQDPRYTLDMVEEVEETIPEAVQLARMPMDEKIYWMLVRRVVRWFYNDGLEVLRDRQEMIILFPQIHEHGGKPQVKDKQTEFTRQTRNLLSDLIMNPFLARILVGDNSVDFDKLMSKGGILLCNTEDGLLGDVSDAFGKLVLMSAQNAVFRRKGEEHTRALVSLYIDEFYNYMNRPFLKLTSNGRKYKLAIFVACQSLSQFAVKFGESYVDSMLGTIRNIVAYGGVTDFDASKLERYFGQELVDELSVRENVTPDRMENPNFSYSESVTRKEQPVASADDIMFNPFKFSYCRLVVDGSTQKAFKAVGDFVDPGEAVKWNKVLDPKALDLFMSYWRSEIIGMEQGARLVVVDHEEHKNEEEALRELSRGMDQELNTLKVSKDNEGVNRFVDLDQSMERDSMRKIFSQNEEVAAATPDKPFSTNKTPDHTGERPVKAPSGSDTAPADEQETLTFSVFMGNVKAVKSTANEKGERGETLSQRENAQLEEPKKDEVLPKGRETQETQPQSEQSGDAGGTRMEQLKEVEQDKNMAGLLHVIQKNINDKSGGNKKR